MSSRTEPAIYDPVAFAEMIYGVDLGNIGFQFAPNEQAELTRMFHELEQACPELTTNLVAHELFGRLNDAAWNVITASVAAGLRAGALIEQFRAGMVPPTRTCPACLGYFTRPEGNGREHCTTCNGAGVVPRP